MIDPGGQGPIRPWPASGLLTDLYHVDAAYVAWRAGHNAQATFDLYTRGLPFGGGFLLLAGLEAAATFARDFRYSDDELAFLATVKPYDPAFLAMLGSIRFTGDIAAIPEGTVAFANEPLVRVTAPFIEALLMESGLLHATGLETLIATKAARVVHAARGRPVTEFAFRRAQEPFAVARAAAIGGCVATSFVAAARAYGIPAAGTIPHALIQAFDDEAAAFRAVAETLDHFTLLLDTYDPRHAIHTAAAVAHEAEHRWGHTLDAVRLDSGDLGDDSRYVRSVLNDAGLQTVKIVVSSDLDEFSIDELLRDGAPIDGFGVGTSVGVGTGPASRGIEGGSLGTVYKLVDYGDDQGQGSPGRIKLAGPKSTWPGIKQVHRRGDFDGDVISLVSELPPAGSQPLLAAVMEDGSLHPDALPSLGEIRERATSQLAALPLPYHALTTPPPYPVGWSDALVDLRQQISDRPWQGEHALARD